jgi:tetratricopeptide (TPR) repeat protein
VAVLGEATRLVAGKGTPDRRAKLLLKEAKATGEAGRAEEAVGLLERAEGLLDPVEDRELSLYARQARAAWLLDSGRVDEATSLFEAIREPWRRHVPGARNQLRLDWLGAKIAWSREDREAAESGFRAVRRAAAEQEADYLFALVSLDLAGLHLEQGRTGEVRRLAEEMLPVFSSRQIHHEALAALVLFERAAAAETASVALVRDLVTYLRRARNNPDLPFRDGVARGGSG